MRRDPLVSVFVALASVTVCTVVVWLLFFRPTDKVVRERTRTGPTLVIQTPPLTPLQAKRTSAARSPDSRSTNGVGGSPSASPNPSKSVQGLGKPTGPKASTGLPKRRKRQTASHPHQPAPASPAPSTPPQTQPQPPPLVTVPLPSICTQPVHVGTCP